MFDDRTVFAPQKQSAVIDRDGWVLLKYGLHQYCLDWWAQARQAFKTYGMEGLMQSWAIVEGLTDFEIAKMLHTSGWVPPKVREACEAIPIGEEYFEALHLAERALTESGPKRSILPLFDKRPGME